MTIEICPKCKGEGETTHRDDWGDYLYNTCSLCSGSGRLKTLRYTTTIPFSDDNTNLYKVDSEIRKLIESLRKY
jgi:DnaJ-class molecular chaperone